jgi:hypothetical protein
MYNEEIAPRLRSGTALGCVRGPPLAALGDRPRLRSWTGRVAINLASASLGHCGRAGAQPRPFLQDEWTGGRAQPRPTACRPSYFIIGTCLFGGRGPVPRYIQAW